MAELRWLSSEDVAACADMREMIRAVGNAFRAYSLGRAVSPQRTVLALPDGVTLAMPAALPEERTTAVKVVSVYPGNPARSLPTILGLIAVLDATTGEPVALMEGAYLTGVRTGAASGVATNVMARADVETLGLIGTGFQARFQAEAVACVRPLRTIRVYGRDPDRRERFAAELRSYLRDRGHVLEVVAVASAREAVRDAGVVCAATTSSEPVFEDEHVSEGTHVNGVGSFRLDMHETPLEFVRRATVFVDSREAAETEAGDLLPAVEAGPLDWASLPEIGEVLSGVAPGRRSESEVTFFKSVGLPVQDVAAAGLAARRAMELGLGQRLKL